MIRLGLIGLLLGLVAVAAVREGVRAWTNLLKRGFPHETGDHVCKRGIFAHRAMWDGSTPDPTDEAGA